MSTSPLSIHAQYVSIVLLPDNANVPGVPSLRLRSPEVEYLAVI